MESRNTTRLLLSSLKCSYKAHISDGNSEGGHKLENIEKKILLKQQMVLLCRFMLPFRMNALSLWLILVTFPEAEMWSPKLQGKFRPFLLHEPPHVNDGNRSPRPPAHPAAGTVTAQQWDAVGVFCFGGFFCTDHKGLWAAE